MGHTDSSSLKYYRDVVSQAFHDHMTKEYYGVRPGSQKLNLQKMFVYAYRTLEWIVLLTDHLS